MGILLGGTDLVSIYEPRQQKLSDENVVPGLTALVKRGVRCNIHRGRLSLQDAQSFAGVDTSSYSTAYFEIDQAPFLVNRRFLLDQFKDVYLIRSVPVVRNRFGAAGKASATSHIKCILQKVDVPPDGIPQI